MTPTEPNNPALKLAKFKHKFIAKKDYPENAIVQKLELIDGCWDFIEEVCFTRTLSRAKQIAKLLNNERNRHVQS